MTPVGQTIASVLWIYLLILIARIVLDYVQMFARRYSNQRIADSLTVCVNTPADSSGRNRWHVVGATMNAACCGLHGWPERATIAGWVRITGSTPSGGWPALCRK